MKNLLVNQKFTNSELFVVNYSVDIKHTPDVADKYNSSVLFGESANNLVIYRAQSFKPLHSENFSSSKEIARQIEQTILAPRIEQLKNFGFVHNAKDKSFYISSSEDVVQKLRTIKNALLGSSGVYHVEKDSDEIATFRVLLDLSIYQVVPASEAGLSNLVLVYDSELHFNPFEDYSGLRKETSHELLEI